MNELEKARAIVRVGEKLRIWQLDAKQNPEQSSPIDRNAVIDELVEHGIGSKNVQNFSDLVDDILAHINA